MPDTVALDPDSGELTFLIKSPPISLQAAAPRKEAVRELVREQTRRLDFLISGDIQIEIEWLLNERRRYESHVSPDVDNVLKPTLDALCGPQGVLIDDCQVQAVACRWIDWTRDDEQFEIRMRFFPDERVSKSGLAFVHMGGSLCFPFDTEVPPLALMVMAQMVTQMFDAKDELIRQGAGYEAASRVMPVQRLFNRARVAAKFPVEDLPTFMRSVETQAKASLAGASPKEAALYKKIEPEFSEALLNAERRFL